MVAGAGARVVKHGNRAASSSCGTADVLEELGVRSDAHARPGRSRCASRSGITFCFAQVFHPAIRHAAGPRREIGVPTSFNFLGPLTNPAQPAAQAIGCADPRMAPVMAQVFAERGESALVFRGDDGLDELTVSTTSSVWRVARWQRAPRDRRPGAARHRARRSRRCVAETPPTTRAWCATCAGGEQGPIRDAVMLNAAAAFVALDDAAGRGDGPCTTTDWRCGSAGGVRRSTRCVPREAIERWVSATPRWSRLAAPSSYRWLLEAERERGLEVVPAVGAEGDVRLGVHDARRSWSRRPVMTSASSSCARTRTIAMRSTPPVTEYTSLTSGNSTMLSATAGIWSTSHCDEDDGGDHQDASWLLDGQRRSQLKAISRRL